MQALDLKELAQEHLDDARAIHDAGRYSGAMYLAGYAVECSLKFAICSVLGWKDFPPGPEHRALKSHDLNFLLEYTGRVLDIKKYYSYQLAWDMVGNWNPEMRYNAGRMPTKAQSSDYLINVSELVKLLSRT